MKAAPASSAALAFDATHASPTHAPEAARRTRAALRAFEAFRRARGISDEAARAGTFDASAFLAFLRTDYASHKRPARRGLTRTAAWRHFTHLAKAWAFRRARGIVGGDPFGPVLRQSAGAAEFEEAVARVPRTSAGRQRFAAIARLGRECRLSIDELVALDLDDFDAAHGHLRVRRGRERGKRLVLSPPARAALDAYLRQGRALSVTDPAERALFLNRYRGGRLSAAALAKHLNMLGVRWSRVTERYRKWISA